MHLPRMTARVTDGLAMRSHNTTAWEAMAAITPHGGVKVQLVHSSSREIEKDNFRDCQGKQIRTESEESFEYKVLKQKKHCVAVAVAVMVS